MHLHDLLERKNRSLVVSDGVVPARRVVQGEVILGVELAAHGLRRLVVPNASEHPGTAGADDIGLGAQLDEGAPLDRCAIRVSHVAGQHVVSRVTAVQPGAYSRLLLPSLLDLPDPFAKADLVIECTVGDNPLFIGCSGRTPREALYRLATGEGVEIGPGPRPQIHNSATTRVRYVEEMSAQEWAKLYRPDAAADAWQQPGYIIGQAHALPVDDGSLDFIFSSHVLEHLYNPLGHFDHWRRKLKPGGLVLAVVPGADGTKDFVRPATSLPALIDEHRTGQFAVPISSYERWVRELQPGHPDPHGFAQQQFRERVSIHVHVYDYVTIHNLLRHCVKSHGYLGYRLFYKRNAKDFVFALKADHSRVSP